MLTITLKIQFILRATSQLVCKFSKQKKIFTMRGTYTFF